MNIFGTDGIRGRANNGYITPDNIMKIAISSVMYYSSLPREKPYCNGKFTVVIGKDTRLSGYMLESALMAGFISSGADVRLLGPIPTPAVSVITRSLRADLGVVISASHNPYEDNGIKFFNSRGFKISPYDEMEISKIFHNNNFEFASPDHMGKARRIDDADGRYVEFVKSSFPRDMTLSGMKIVIDTANGASYKIAPEVFWELGAEIIHIGNDPDGLNINKGCGATDTKLLQKTVIENNADIGFAFDGDADRLIVVDDRGDIVDGDYILASIATDWKSRGKLINNKVVATTMSNMGLERYLKNIGIELIRSDVGDKYVLEKMIESGARIGGEKSGHIIPIDYASTGDGMVSALQVISFLMNNRIKSSKIRDLYKTVPQSFLNIKKNIDLNDKNVQDIIYKIRNDILKDTGRIVIRRSGTENLIRVMIESDEKLLIEKSMELIEDL